MISSTRIIVTRSTLFNITLKKVFFFFLCPTLALNLTCCTLIGVFYYRLLNVHCLHWPKIVNNYVEFLFRNKSLLYLVYVKVFHVVLLNLPLFRVLIVQFHEQFDEMFVMLHQYVILMHDHVKVIHVLGVQVSKIDHRKKTNNDNSN
jgi:hypothetical protein